MKSNIFEKDEWQNDYNEFNPKPVSEVDEADEIWRQKRKGNFTGSAVKDLMTCDRSGSKLNWEDPNKIYSWGETARKYVYEKAMERKTGYLSGGFDSWQMRHGTENESYVIEAMMIRQEFSDFEKCDFVLSNEVPNLGATPDGKVRYKGEIVAVEIKSTVSWSGFRDRMSLDFNEKHGDWWQWQTEMHVLGLDKLAFVVAYPMQSDDFEVEIIESSDIHIQALKKRVEIANRAIEMFIESGSRKIDPFIGEACFVFSEK